MYVVLLLLLINPKCLKREFVKCLILNHFVRKDPVHCAGACGTYVTYVTIMLAFVTEVI